MPVNATPYFKKLYRLKTILLVVLLSVLILPLSMLYFFRFYENELVQKTELELITQSAVFAAMYLEFTGHTELPADIQFKPITPQFDLSTQSILPRRPAAHKVITNNEDSIDAETAGKKMQNILLHTQLVTLAGIRILDQYGTVVAGRQETGLSLAHVEEVKTALKGQYQSVLRERVSDEPAPPLSSLSRGAGIRVFTAFPVMAEEQVIGVIYLSRTPQNILKYLYQIKEKVFLLVMLLLGITLLIVLFLSARLSQPIRALISQAHKLMNGEVETVEVLDQPGTYELYELSNSFSKMSKTLRQRSLYIEQFASHVSHEFKTPLTSMQGTLELLQEHYDQMSENQRQNFINNLQEDTERLKQLVKRLLQQGRADALQKTTEVTNLMQVVERVKKHSTLQWLIDDEIQNQHVNISAAALDCVVSNLAENSLHHGATQLRVSYKKKARQVLLAFLDNGTGISESNKTRIFTPFFTTRRENGGTGLGLGIIKSTLNAWDGDIELAHSESGTLFVVTLNCADFK